MQVMDDAARRSLQSDVVLFTSSKGKGQFFTAEQLYAALGAGTGATACTLEEFRGVLKGMAAQHLLQRWRPNPAEGDVFSAP